MSLLSGWLGGLQASGGAFDGVAQAAFFKLIFGFLDNEIDTFRDNLLGQALSLVSGLALVLLTIWILIQGYRIATGQSRDSLMALVTNSLRSILIIVVAAGVAFGSSDLYHLFTTDMPQEITRIVTSEGGAPEDMIDKSLDKMQLAMIGIDALSTVGDQGLKDDKDRALLFTGVGVAGPSVVGGAMLLLYKIALALFVGLGPMFILSLLFEQTKPLFGRWLYYGIGTMFSLAVLSFMVAVAMKMVLAVAGAFAAQYVAAMALHSAPIGISSMSLQQGGLGLILTVLMIMTPPMAASFFQGTLGQFTAYSAFGGIGRGTDAGGRPAGSPGYMPTGAPQSNARHPETIESRHVAPKITGFQPTSEPSSGQRGLADRGST